MLSGETFMAAYAKLGNTKPCACHPYHAEAGANFDDRTSP